nr:immunoglobulin heavy chain junction region [Macaca mulatta]MOY23862.1 immunoglobulin heavy chain junction region [Macaca mulatta]MOY24032.1 immunoglobulin heavy chain junction region [Macaca mulatta]MOY24551.1 immunoglobulin heavy chain junction region [Macaca mulatta]MOY25401.1 immunoglobulin heavy chain junction region [Macaca mulatta]
CATELAYYYTDNSYYGGYFDYW